MFAADLLARGGWTVVAIAALSLLGWWIACHRLLSLDAERAAIHARLAAALAPTRTLPQRKAGLQASLRQERARLAAALGLMPPIAAVCPLLGLLGTLFGLITTFAGLGSSAQTGAMADGVARALTTTQVGLVAALPLLILHGWANARTERLLHALERHHEAMEVRP